MVSAQIGLQLGRSLVEQLGDDCGAASVVARAIEASPVGTMLTVASAEGLSAGAFLRVAADFARRGWLVREGGCWKVPMDGALPRGVSAFLEGAASMRTVCTESFGSVAIVTMPPSPSAIANALPGTGLAHAALVGTNDAFERVADAARVSLTVMTPFLNDDGLSWALRLFDRTTAPRRRLIVRGDVRARRVLKAQRAAISGTDIEVLSYAVPAPAGDGYETFHAKVLLADSSLAYVGSANLLAYSRHSMELGILTSGRAAVAVASVVRAVEVVATPFDPESD